MVAGLPRWRSESAERRFRAVEDELWADRCERQPRVLDVAGRWGTTRVYEWPGAGDPVVLLHGMGGTSVMWSRFVIDLAPRRVIAVDTLGDVGRSAPSVAFRDVAEIAGWLDETLASLELERAHLVGNSYGGWLALNHALHHGDRLASIGLLDPVGLAAVSWRFYLWGLAVLAASCAPTPVRRRLGLRLGMPVLEDRRPMRMVRIGQLNHPFRLPSSVLTGEALRSVACPVLLLMGANSQIYRPSVVLARVEHRIADLEAAVIEHVGHALPLDPRAEAASRVRDFVDAVDARLASPGVNANESATQDAT